MLPEVNHRHGCLRHQPLLQGQRYHHMASYHVAHSAKVSLLVTSSSLSLQPPTPGRTCHRIECHLCALALCKPAFTALSTLLTIYSVISRKHSGRQIRSQMPGQECRDS